jgi:hypothetical protein
VSRPVPTGYVRLEDPRAEIVVHGSLVDAVRAALDIGGGSLHTWAARHDERRELQGRVAAYAVPLPGGAPRVVVRRSHHGGQLAPVLGDLFFPPTRAPRELTTSLLLAAAGVPTPPVVAYAIGRAGALFRRVDVLTIELPGNDLGAMLTQATSPAARRELLPPVAALLGALTQAGAWHPDLNVKNVLLVRDESGALHPAVLDIDRVSFVPAGDPNLREANLQRLERSSRKLQTMHGAGFDAGELEELRQMLVRDEVAQAANRALAIKDFMP